MTDTLPRTEAPAGKQPRTGSPFGLNYLGFTSAMGFSSLGDAAWYIALTWTLARSVSPSTAGALLALASLPRMVALLGGGVLADRKGPRAVMVATDLLRFAVMLGAAGVIAVAGPSVPLLFAVAAVVALLSAFFIPASGAVKPLLLEERDLVRGNALYMLGLRGGQAAGGPIGAWLLGVGGVASIAVANAVGYLLSATGSWRVRYLREPAPPAERKPFWPQLVDGLRYLRHERGILLPVALIALTELACAPPVNLGLVILSGRLGDGAGGAGLLLTAYTVGSVLSAVISMALPPLKRGGLVLLVDTALAGGCLLGIGLVHSLWPAFTAYALLGLVAGQSGVVLVSLTQRRTAAEVRGRVMAVLSLVIYVSAPLANLVYGVLLGPVGFAGTMAGFAALAFAATVITAVTPGLRSVRLD
ncbi:MFS family permease [Streptacidiphilus sp. MAP12-33]|uniref:MFS transporter n=1 Tax=Streptacidiphilus sp. MAP12-33 TaxID=3156266 RepID=UPI00351390D5